MNTTFNSAVEDDQSIECVGRCMVGCGWRETVADGYPHGPHCERAVGSEANGVTEPGWTPTQFWCTVIAPHLKGRVPESRVRGAERHQDGVQLVAMAHGEITVDTESQVGWSEVRFNMRPSEARTLAAHLTAVADSHDRIDASAFITRKLDKLAERLGVDISGA